MSKPVIGFAGMTHLGVNSAAGALERGFRVVAFDDDVSVIEALRQARPPVIEPGLEEILRARKENITYSNRAADLRGCSVVYISTDVATDDDGRSDLGAVHKLIDKVLPELRPDALLVVLSQVPPGFTRTLALAPARLYYQVETLVFGRAVDRAVNPERFIVGCANPQAPLPVAYREFLTAFGCPVLPMRYESAELAKIAINCCLVASVSVANTLAELCERIGAAWAEIAPALKLDKRIGPHAYLAPGLGIAGGNLERDLATVIRLAGEAGTDAGVVKAWVANSRHRRDWAARTIRKVLLEKNPKAVIAVWGLAYKENTHSTKNSPSLATIAQMPEATLQLHDPVVAASSVRHAKAKPAAEPLEAARNADALMILTPWPQYRSVDPAAVASVMRGKIVIDPYGVMDARKANAAGLSVYTLGQPPTTANA
ncbi:MAG TPA: nucleotide sugar dehydrogenase [Burkholderiales bacterium]|nr:nucleotide sugar dehydrogenase [Burkholderiales bacterium]